MLPETLSGDGILSASKTWLSKAIRLFGKLHTGSASRSHVAVCIGEGQIIEALSEIRINDIEKYEKEDIEIWRVPLSEDEQDDFRSGIIKMAGDNYGWLKIPLHAMDSFVTFCTRPIRKKPFFWFTQKFGISSFKVCSHLYVYALHTFTDYRLLGPGPWHEEVDWRTVSPDYLQDLLALPHNKAQLIYKQVTNI